MPLATGNPSVTTTTPAGITITSTAITGGTAPYSSQLYSQLIEAFDTGDYPDPNTNVQPNAGWVANGAPVVGATPTFLATGLTPGIYAFEYVTTDSAGTPATATSPEVLANQPKEPPLVTIGSTTVGVVRYPGEIPRFAFSVPSTASHTISLVGFAGADRRGPRPVRAQQQSAPGG